jgi:hypothetical protein
MYSARLRTPETFRRRRRFGLYALAGILLACLALNDWRISPLWTLFDVDEGTFTAGDPYGEWIYAVCDGDRQQVAVLSDGRVNGAEALGSLRQTRFPDWCGLPTVDLDDIGAWRTSLERLQDTIAAPDASAAEILDQAREMPVSVLYLKPLADWVRADPTHASAFLDAVARRPMSFSHENAAIRQARAENFSALIDGALETVSLDDVPPDALQGWLAADQIVDSGRALPRLATSEAAPPAALAAMLTRLESVSPRDRAEVYDAIAPRLASHGNYARLLGNELKRLPPQSRTRAALELLMQPDASPELPLALLGDFRGLFGRGNNALELFMAIADKISRNDGAPVLLTTHLKDLADMERRMAATYLLGLDRPGETTFALGVLRAFSDLHPMSRPKVLYAIMLSGQFQDRTVQEACVLAVQLELRGPDQQELLTALLRHQSLDGELQSRIRAIVG